MPANRLSILAKYRDQARLREARQVPPPKPETRDLGFTPNPDLARFKGYESRPQ